MDNHALCLVCAYRHFNPCYCVLWMGITTIVFITGSFIWAGTRLTLTKKGKLTEHDGIRKQSVDLNENVFKSD